ncbi:MAG: hypothetical protein ACPGR8_17040 [Limisphaerales bacterium]
MIRQKPITMPWGVPATDAKAAVLTLSGQRNLCYFGGTGEYGMAGMACITLSHLRAGAFPDIALRYGPKGDVSIGMCHDADGTAPPSTVVYPTTTNLNQSVVECENHCVQDSTCRGWEVDTKSLQQQHKCTLFTTECDGDYDLSDGYVSSYTKGEINYDETLLQQADEEWKIKAWDAGPLVDFASAVWSNTLHVIGGRLSTDPCTDEHRYYDGAADSVWTLSSIPYPVAICKAAAVMDNKLYVAGGQTPVGATDKVYYLTNPNTNWVLMTDTLPSPMASLSLLAFGPLCDQLMLLGRNNRTNATLLLYRQADSTAWSSVEGGNLAGVEEDIIGTVVNGPSWETCAGIATTSSIAVPETTTTTNNAPSSPSTTLGETIPTTSPDGGTSPTSPTSPTTSPDGGTSPTSPTSPTTRILDETTSVPRDDDDHSHPSHLLLAIFVPVGIAVVIGVGVFVCRGENKGGYVASRTLPADDYAQTIM